MPCTLQSTRRSAKLGISEGGLRMRKSRTKGTPAKFQKMTMKPHLKKLNNQDEQE